MRDDARTSASVPIFFGDRRRDVLADIAALTGGQLLIGACREYSVDQLGRAGRIEVGEGTTTLMDGKGSREEIRARVDELRATINDTGSDHDREQCEERLANLLAGVGGGEISLPASTQRLQARPSPLETWWSARRLGQNWGFLGAGAALVLLGLVVMYGGRAILGRAEESGSWPTVQGEVFSSEVVHSQVRNVTGSQTHRTSTNARVKFAYTVKGKRYEGDRIRFGSGVGGSDWGSTEEAEAGAARYPVGKAVTVFYNPEAPERSVLEPGSAYLERWPIHVLLIGLGSLFLALFLSGRIGGLLRRR